MRHRVPQLWQSGAESAFTVEVHLRLPEQMIPYIPNASEALKWAWVQYIALFLLLAWFLAFVRAFVFRYQLVPTYIASDTRPPQKVHQF